MKTLIKAIIGILIIFLVGGGALWYYRDSSRPALNGNEKTISASIDKKGKPTEVLGDVNDIKLSKNQKKAYVSLPVNHRSLKESRVTVSYKDKVIEDKLIEVSDAGYVNYLLDDIENREAGMYLLTFYDENGERCQCAGVTIE